ncbi:Kinesin-like protein [Arachis hypogaea]|nr:Kinesin-like protein [Arachis hypogaea]
MGETPPAATPMSKIQRNLLCTPGGGAKFKEEKIRVTVRMRPLNRKEQAMYDLIAWECLDEHSIIFKNPIKTGLSHHTPSIRFLLPHAQHRRL